MGKFEFTPTKTLLRSSLERIVWFHLREAQTRQNLLLRDLKLDTV